MAITGETKYSTILDIAFTQKWTLDYLQAQLRIKEVKLIPHNYEDLTGIQQRRQPYKQPEGTRLPEALKLPYPIFKVVSKDNPSYLKFRELFSSGDLKAAKLIKDKLIKAYEAKVQVRRTELLNDTIDVDDMLGDIDDLHMGPMELTEEVTLDSDINLDLELYPNVVPAPCPDLTPITLDQVINRRGSVNENSTSSYIVTDSGAEMVTLGAGWLITKRGNMPSINIAGPCQEMGQINMYRGSGITRVTSTNHGHVLLRAENNALIYPEQLRHQEQETLFSHSQLRENGVQVEDCPQRYGGAQCLILSHEYTKFVLPLSYEKGITTLTCDEPTDEELNTLPIIDIIDPTGFWHPHNVGTEEFDLQMCVTKH